MKSYTPKVFLPLLFAGLLVFCFSYNRLTTDLTTQASSFPTETQPIAQSSATYDMTDLKSYIITLKESASSTDISTIKAKIHDLGGSIVNEFTLFKGFLVKLPSIHSSSIGSHDVVATIEEDSEVNIQKPTPSS